MVEKILPRVGLEFEATRSVGQQATVAPKLHMDWQILQTLIRLLL